MALDSTSTLDDALAQYNNNLDWDGDATKAAAALAAVRWIVINRPRIIATNNRTINFEDFAAEKRRLEEFVSHAGPNVNRCSFVRGRMLT